MAYPTQGAHPLTGVEGLPNVTIAFNGEHWSDAKASGEITPGECIVPTVYGEGASAVGMWVPASAAGASAQASQAAIAMRTVDVPDPNRGPNELGPNEVRNQVIADGEWVHAYFSGAFNLTLIVPDSSYKPKDLIGWDRDGVRPAGKDGVGAWAKNADADLKNFFEVIRFRPIGSGGEGILTVRSLRGQF